jgi:hypothetical protein
MTQFYEIRIEGHLDGQWADWFDGMSITLEEDGTTLLSGHLPDQSALYGLLRKVRDLGLPLVAVRQVTGALNPQSTNNKGATQKMNANATTKPDTKVLLSTLWIVVMINMLKADILSLYIPGVAEELVNTSATTGTPIPLLMLGGAIMMEISIAMILFSRILKYSLNRWANIVVSLITIAFVVGGGVTYPHYIFIAAVEVICLLVIIWLSWKWRSTED